MSELIEAFKEALPPEFEFDEREQVLLRLAAHQLEEVELAEADIAARGYLVPGSQGQMVTNPSVSQARNGRLVLMRLLGELDLPGAPKAATRRAQRAAQSALAGGFLIARLRQPGGDFGLAEAFRMLSAGAGPRRRTLARAVELLRATGIDHLDYDQELVELAKANGSSGIVALDLATALDSGVESLFAGPPTTKE